MRDFSQRNFFQRWFFLEERELFSGGFFLRPVRFGIYIFKKTSVSLLQLKNVSLGLYQEKVKYLIYCLFL